MKKIIIAAAIAGFFSTMANAGEGMADRVNEARSYPNKVVIKISHKPDTLLETCKLKENKHTSNDTKS